MGLHMCVEDALEELRDAFNNDPDDVNDDWIMEQADSSVPIYYSDILDYCSDDISLFTTAPDHAAGGESPDKLVQYNIYEHILGELYAEWDRLKEELEDAAYDEEVD